MKEKLITEAELFHRGHPPTAAKVVPCTLGSMNYHVLRTIIEEGDFLQLGVGAEVGVLEAVTSEYLLKNFPELTLHCVDPYASYQDHEPNRTSSAMNSFEQKARARLARFGDRAKFLKQFSVDGAQYIADASLDFVFIDALHTYDALSADLQAWYPKVRSGGLVAGHDVSWNGIKQAVEDFITPYKIPAFYSPSTSDVWFFVKP